MTTGPFTVPFGSIIVIAEGGSTRAVNLAASPAVS
jgi:hypothetical protein